MTQACPGLVEQVEAGELDSAKTRELVERYTRPLLERGADTLVLGCTHYPFLRPLIAELAGSGVKLIDTGEAVARQVVRRLPERLLGRMDATPDERFWTTGDARAAHGIVSQLWGRPVASTLSKQRPPTRVSAVRRRSPARDARGSRASAARRRCDRPRGRRPSRAVVGMLRTSKRLAVCGFSSTLSFATRAWPPSSAASSSSVGASVRHGPHHGAQASTSTGSGERSTSAAKVASVTVSGAASSRGNGCLQRPQTGA